MAREASNIRAMSRVGLCSVLPVSEPVAVGAAQGPDDGFHLVAAGLRLAA
jgi:hypothetical protein